MCIRDRYYDCGIAAQTFCLAAHELGLGTVILSLIHISRDGYSVFYAVNTPSPEQTEELLARLVQLAVLEDGLSPEALAPDPDAYAQGRGETDPMESKDAAAPPPLAGVSAWQSQPWFGGYYYDNDTCLLYTSRCV